LIICLFVFLLYCQSSAVDTGKKSKSPMQNKICLVSVGKIEEWLLDILADHLEKTFAGEVKIGETVKLPPDAYNPSRKQYFSSLMLNELRQTVKPAKGQKFLAISNVDLYVEGLNFVFGEAELGGHFAIISLARLRQEFYGFLENKTLYLERAKKEAVHELGHTFGLRHCPDPVCVMYFSNSLRDTDRKRTSFCPRCEEFLKKSNSRE